MTNLQIENQNLINKISELEKDVELKSNIIVNILTIITEENNETLRDKILKILNNTL